MVWRRLLVRSDSTITDLHYTIQIAIGCSDSHLNRFHIHGQDYGVYRDGGISFTDNPERVRPSLPSRRAMVITTVAGVAHRAN